MSERPGVTRCRNCKAPLVDRLGHGQYMFHGRVHYSGRTKALICPNCQALRPFEFH